jgi:putative serine protease PepD
MTTEADRATDPTEPYVTPDRGSVLPPPPPARPWNPPPTSSWDPPPTQPESVRTISGRGVNWPTAPPSGDPASSERPPADPTPWNPAWSPTGAAQERPLPPTPPPSSPSAPSGGARRGPFVAVLAVVALVAGLLGAFIGVKAADDDDVVARGPSPTVDRNTSNQTQPSVAPPITGPVDEPAAAVAGAVGPAVVLIQSTVGEGSGIIYDASGLIVTNAHVVEGFDRVNVTLADGEIYENAEVVGADENRDVAVVRIEPREQLTAAAFGATDDVHVGQIAIAIGSPFGLEQTVTSGIVSAVGRVVSATNPVEMIQTDAPINPGNSGGPLADAQGRVIGMNTSIRTADGTNGSVGVGFAIPSDTLTDIAQRIVGGESLEVAYLGVRGSAPTGSSAGVVLMDVRPNSPAETAGLQEGDQVSAIDGDPVTNMSSLSARIQLHSPDDTVTLTIERDGQQQDVPVTLGSAGG